MGSYLDIPSKAVRKVMRQAFHVPGPIARLAPDALRRQFESNVFGPVWVTQAFLPLLRQARGRIINLGSVGGQLTIPFGGALCASK